MHYPTISIIIPSWNQGKFIERTLLSILKQDYPGNVQIIVSDGGSSDETVEILRKYNDQIQWWSKPDKGFVDAVMKGAEKATGEVLAIQSSDDYYLPGAFVKMAKAFSENPDVLFISGGDIYIDLNNNVITRYSYDGYIDPKVILFNRVPPQHASFLKREYFEKVGGLRLEVDMCADIDLWYRVAHLGKGYHISDDIAVYQVHPDQRTQTSDKWSSSLIKMVETCENDPIYKKKFKLSDEDKLNVYTYWKINWSAQTNNLEKAAVFADEALDFYDKLDDRSQTFVRMHSPKFKSSQKKTYLKRGIEAVKDGSFFKKILSKVLPSVENNVVNTVPESKAFEIDFNWWSK